jgi:transposase
MHVESILRRLQPQPGFVYEGVRFAGPRAHPSLWVHVRPRRRSRGVCSSCFQKRRGYDVLTTRHFAFVPLWGLPVWLVYAMRRVDCPRCGVTVEAVPWATGKMQTTHALAWFLASWAKVLSWKETARRFHTSWDTVFRCVEHAVRWGLAHRDLDGICAIGVDELSWKKRHKYMTLVYQLDHGRRRLLHIAETRTARAFHGFFDMLGEERSGRILFVASDMWRAFLSVVRARCSSATHVLDRFHVMQLLSKAIDKVRRDEVHSLRAAGRPALLTKTRWVLLKRRENRSSKDRRTLRGLLGLNLRSIRACLLKEEFQHFWTYRSLRHAEAFLGRWTTMAMRSKLAPFKTFANTLRQHQREILNWIATRNLFAIGATEGFNNKARVTTRKAYGFRSYEHAEIALYHALGELPEPDWLAHRFC